ncbi:formate dehydrogenase subunit delta [Bordetella sp. N]|uniref:formate dehydrogenase subunit delta n=1 Tax=Bordetella sp. N TaxID=1746199 RepID=UPI00070B0647|nr:formate dehydrogenase subunit delta [Bordetella sp. N]ALM83242.1 formate dehydrogenase [Bordetella sp. N]
MDPHNLIRMANRIGDFFDAMPDRPEALEGIAGHIQKFWEPRMRNELLAFLQAHPDGIDGDTTLAPIVLEAVTQYRERLLPRVIAPANNPV